MKDFNLPESQAELDSMIAKMKDCGMDSLTATGVIRARKVLFDQATLN